VFEDLKEILLTQFFHIAQKKTKKI
jgi:hypothetical protein